MSTERAEFNAYYVYLGIPPRDQPPNHYRLLGLELFESDLGIIEMAADRQMGHLQRHESGDHVEQVANLMSEVSRARLCLLDNKKKTAYDRKLTKTSVPPPTAKAATRRESSGPSASKRHPQLAPFSAVQDQPLTPNSPEARRHVSRSLAPVTQLDQTTDTFCGKPRWPIFAGIGAGIAGLALVAIVIAVMLGGKPDADSNAVVEPSTNDSTPADSVTPDVGPAPDEDSQDVVDQDLKPPSLDTVRIEPETPTEGDDVQIWLPKETRLVANVDYRADSRQSWQRIKQLPSNGAMGGPNTENDFPGATFASPDRQFDAPTLTLPEIQAGELRLEIREMDAQSNASEPVYKQIVVRENPWLKWKPTESIKHSQAIQQVGFAQDGKLLSVRAGSAQSSTGGPQVDDQTIQFTWWNLAEGTLNSETSTVDTLAATVRDDGALLMIQQTRNSTRVPTADAIDDYYRAEPTVSVQYLLHAVSDNRRLSLYEGSHPATAVALSPSGRFVAISFSGEIEIAGIPNGPLPTNLAVPLRHRGEAVAPAEAFGLGAYGGGEGQYPSEGLYPTGEEPYASGQANLIDPRIPKSGRLQFSPDESLLFVVKDELQVWQVAQQRRMRDLKVQAKCIAVSNDGKRLAIGTGGVIQIWKFPEGQLVRTIEVGESSGAAARVGSGVPGIGSLEWARPGQVTHLSIHPQGDALAAAVDNQVYVYEVGAGRRLNTSVRHGGVISDLSFSSDGKILATGGVDGMVQLWQVSDRQPKVITAPAHKPAWLVRIDSLVNAQKYGQALDAMKLPVPLPRVTVAADDLLGGFDSEEAGLLDELYGADDDILLEQPSRRGVARRPLRGSAIPLEGMDDGGYEVPGGYGASVGGMLTFTQMIADHQFKLLHKTLSYVQAPRLHPELRNRFVDVQTRLEEEHKKLADEALKAAETKSGTEQEQANYLIYKDFPSELLPDTFTTAQQRLQESRQQQAEANWKRAVQFYSRGGRQQARNYLLKVIAMKTYLPEESAKAEKALQQYDLRN